MITAWRTLAFGFVLVGAIGCNRSITSFVAGVAPPSSETGRAPAQDPGPVTTTTPGVKITPGAVDATAGSLRMKASVGVHDHVYSMGADRRAKLSLTSSFSR